MSTSRNAFRKGFGKAVAWCRADGFITSRNVRSIPSWVNLIIKFLATILPLKWSCFVAFFLSVALSSSRSPSFAFLQFCLLFYVTNFCKLIWKGRERDSSRVQALIRCLFLSEEMCPSGGNFLLDIVSGKWNFHQPEDRLEKIPRRR